MYTHAGFPVVRNSDLGPGQGINTLMRIMLVVNIGFVVCAGAVAASSVIHIPRASTAEPAVPGSAGNSAAWHSAAGSAAE